MTTEAPEPRAPSETEKVVSYLEQRFFELGFNVRQSAELAERNADWHEADRLLADGCPLETALDILL
jgi:hypothetical protein